MRLATQERSDGGANPRLAEGKRKQIMRLAEPEQSDGGARRDRTDDLLVANQALSQLSYGP